MFSNLIRYVILNFIDNQTETRTACPFGSFGITFYRIFINFKKKINYIMFSNLIRYVILNFIDLLCPYPGVRIW